MSAVSPRLVASTPGAETDVKAGTGWLTAFGSPSPARCRANVRDSESPVRNGSDLGRDAREPIMRQLHGLACSNVVSAWSLSCDDPPGSRQDAGRGGREEARHRRAEASMSWRQQSRPAGVCRSEPAVPGWARRGNCHHPSCWPILRPQWWLALDGLTSAVERLAGIESTDNGGDRRFQFRQGLR